jgi:hypothetical protein
LTLKSIRFKVKEKILEEKMKNSYEVKHVVTYAVELMLVNFKFGVGSPRLIGKFKTWFENLFEVNNPVDYRLRRFETIVTDDPQKVTVLVIVLQNEIRAFYELFEEFCFAEGFGGFEEELEKKLKSLRTLSVEKVFQEEIIIKHEKYGVGKILRVANNRVKILFMRGEIEHLEKTELEIISLKEE